MKLTLQVDNLHVINWFIDTSHQMQKYAKGQTGGAFTLGKGAVTDYSRGQNTNTRSSTETEVVGVDNMLPQVLWTLQFIEAQGYKVKHNTIHQDNVLVGGPPPMLSA